MRGEGGREGGREGREGRGGREGHVNANRQLVVEATQRQSQTIRTDTNSVAAKRQAYQKNTTPQIYVYTSTSM